VLRVFKGDAVPVSPVGVTRAGGVVNVQPGEGMSLRISGTQAVVKKGARSWSFIIGN
jgi:hypothetical protein